MCVRCSLLATTHTPSARLSPPPRAHAPPPIRFPPSPQSCAHAHRSPRPARPHKRLPRTHTHAHTHTHARISNPTHACTRGRSTYASAVKRSRATRLAATPLARIAATPLAERRTAPHTPPSTPLVSPRRTCFDASHKRVSVVTQTIAAPMSRCPHNSGGRRRPNHDLKTTCQNKNNI